MDHTRKDAVNKLISASTPPSERVLRKAPQVRLSDNNPDVVVTPVELIGGSGGEEIDLFAYQQGKVITKLRVYSGEHCIKAYTIWVTNEDGVTYGNPGGESFYDFTFNDGELVASLSLWGNGIGTRAGWIEFTTNTGRTFSHGMYGWDPKTAYPIDVGSGIMVGAILRAGADIDAHGFVFLNPLANSQLTDLQFPTLGFETAGITVETLESFNYTNNSDTPVNWSFSNTVSNTVSSSWTITDGVSAHVTTTVKGGIPEVVDVSGEFGWEVSDSSTYEKTNESTKELSWNISGTASPNTSVNLKAITRKGTINIQYTGVMNVWLVNGATFSYPMSGWYNGVCFTDVTVVNNN